MKIKKHKNDVLVSATPWNRLKTVAHKVHVPSKERVKENERERVTKRRRKRER